jgi:hypothetical protein
MDTGAHSCSDRWFSVRAIDGEAVGGRRPREDPAQMRHALAGGFDNRTTGSSALFNR